MASEPPLEPLDEFRSLLAECPERFRERYSG